MNKWINELRTKIDNNKKKTARIWKTSEKRTKQNCKTKQKANPAE
jgi:hypothetical protein